MEYRCDKCGMGVKNLQCAKCDADLVDAKITTDQGQKVRVAKCPEGCGQIKSPTCCGTDMACST